MWDKMLELFAKINDAIPVDVLFWAGIGVLGVFLVLAILGCCLRARWSIMWLPWLYFWFAALVLLPAATWNTILVDLEFPFLVVLLCYVLLLIFRRSPRYTYVPTTVYERKVARRNATLDPVTDQEKTTTPRTPVIKTETMAREETTVSAKEEAHQAEKDNPKVKLTKAEKAEQKAAAKAAKAEQKNAAKEQRAAEKAQAAEQSTTVKETRTETKVTTKPVLEDNTAVYMPEIKPIPDATPVTVTETMVTPVPAPTISPTTMWTTSATRPVSTNTASTTRLTSNYSNSTLRPITTTANTTLRTAPATSSAATLTAARGNLTSRPVTTTTRVISEPVVRSTTTTTTTTTTTANRSTLNSTRSINSGSMTASSSTTNTKSAQEVLDAIARLRATMNGGNRNG